MSRLSSDCEKLAAAIDSHAESPVSDNDGAEAVDMTDSQLHGYFHAAHPGGYVEVGGVTNPAPVVVYINAELSSSDALRLAASLARAAAVAQRERAPFDHRKESPPGDELATAATGALSSRPSRSD